MKSIKYTSTILNSLYLLIIILFLLDGFTSFDIKSKGIKSFSYFGILIATPILLIWNLIVFKSKRIKMIGAILPAFMLIAIIVIGPMKILFAASAWKTQTILYQNGHFEFKKVEFQMQDVGALGYNKRTVEVIYLTSLFMIVSDVDSNIQQRAEWVKVDKDVNELGLKSP